MNPPPSLPTDPVSTPTPRAVPKTSGMAVAALVCGIFAMIGGAILLVPTVLAIVLGHVAYAKIKADPKLSGSGMAMAGFILGYISIFTVFIMGLLAAMAIPAFQKVREASLQKTMQNDARQIGSAAQQWMMENADKPVRFHIDPQTGEVSGTLSEFHLKVGRGEEEVDGVIENAQDTFSLRNPQLNHGREYIFNADGTLAR